LIKLQSWIWESNVGYYSEEILDDYENQTNNLNLNFPLQQKNKLIGQKKQR
jgi:hypothetical protein